MVVPKGLDESLKKELLNTLTGMHKDSIGKAILLLILIEKYPPVLIEKYPL